MAMPMSSALSKPFPSFGHISTPSSTERPCSVSFSRFHPLCRGCHACCAPILFTEHHPRKKSMAIKSSRHPSPPSMDSSAPPMQRKNWIIELFIRLMLPILKSKWVALLPYKNEVDKVIDTVEEVTEVVQKVAEEVEMEAEELVEQLSDAKTKNAVNFIENVAHKVAKDAEFADSTILKVEEFEDEVEACIDPNLSEGRMPRKEAKRKNEQASEHNHFDIIGGLFSNHYDVLDCLAHHLTSLFR